MLAAISYPPCGTAKKTDKLRVNNRIKTNSGKMTPD
jgi:hypothetical protein